MKNSLTIWRFRSFVMLACLIFACGAFVFAQENEEKKEKKESSSQNADSSKNPTAEQIAETAIAIYSNLGGRGALDQIRKTSVERGKMTINNADGTIDNANYERMILRSENLDKDRVRYNQEFPNVKFALIYDGQKFFGLFNDTVFSPKEEATKAFQNQIWHGLEALLRYKENGSKLEFVGRDKILGVDYFIVNVIDKQDRKTRFYVSAKTYRIMMLEYEQDAIKYRRKFYDYNYAQGTLVPYRSVLWANDKQIEETQVQTITFGQKVEDTMFQEG